LDRKAEKLAAPQSAALFSFVKGFYRQIIDIIERHLMK